jgi:type VI secretion system secreted protein Hcp
MAAAVDYFLKIDTIKGESTDDKHKDEIDIMSWSWSETNSGAHAAGGGGGAGKVSMGDFMFTMQTCKASPDLFVKCATGEHIPEATLVCRKAGKTGQEYLIVKMNDLIISSYQAGGSQGDVLPVDSIALNFSKIEFKYASQKKDGTLDSPLVKNYDLKLNKAG